LLKYNIEQINKDIVTLDTESKNNDLIQRKIELLKANVKNKLSLISKLDVHEYDPNCDYCCNNEFVKSAEKAKIELEHDKITSGELLSENNTSITRMEQFSETHNILKEYNSLMYEQNKYRRFDSELRVKTERRKNSLMSNKHTLLDVKGQISIYHKNEKAIEFNRQINAELSMFESNKEDLRSDVSSNNVKLRDAYSDVSICERNIKEIQNTMQEAHDLELKLKCYEYYLDAIRRDGIPYEIIAETLPWIEEEVNNTLSQIVDFQIQFDVDGKDILSYIKYSDDNKWPLEMTSGMEKFISSLAIRVALIKVSNLPRPNFLIVDEGFGNLDATSLNSLGLLFDYLKSEFDFIMVISHIDIMKDMVDGLVEIEVSGTTSQVQY
jgi:DNA repair exonuclease SbcCD ATPase subunit